MKKSKLLRLPVRRIKELVEDALANSTGPVDLEKLKNDIFNDKSVAWAPIEDMQKDIISTTVETAAKSRSKHVPLVDGANTQEELFPEDLLEQGQTHPGIYVKNRYAQGEHWRERKEKSKTRSGIQRMC